MKIKTIIIPLLSLICFLSTAAYAKSFYFFCNGNGWYPFSGKDYYHAFIKTSDCMSVDRRLALTAHLKAKSLCKEWAESFGIDPKGTTFFFKKNSEAACREQNQKIEHEMEQRRINRIYSYSQQTGLAKTSYYINNTEIEKAIFLADGSEQVQWLQIDDRRFCGTINSDLAFWQTPQSIVVRILSTGQEFTYLRISKKIGEEIFRASSRRFKNFQYLRLAEGLSFFNIDRQGNRQSETGLNISYLDQARGQRHCRPLNW